jgi:hypothetical protein
MPNHVCLGATIKCSQAVPPGMASLIVLPLHMCLTSMKPAANIMDHAPFINIPTFGMCNAKANPTVIAATAAALGTPTPGACIPATPTPWSSGSPSVMLDNKPALNKSSTCQCVYGGTISIQDEGQATHQIP